MLKSEQYDHLQSILVYSLELDDTKTSLCVMMKTPGGEGTNWGDNDVD